MEELDKKYKNNGFKIPDNYFEDFDQKVFAGIHQQNTEPLPQLRFWKKKTIWMAAAGFALISGLSYIAYQTTPATTTQQEISFDNLDPNELMEYENDIELNEDEFEEIIPAYTIDSIYQDEFIPANALEFSPSDIQDLEEEYSALDESIDI